MKHNTLSIAAASLFGLGFLAGCPSDPVPIGDGAASANQTKTIIAIAATPEETPDKQSGPTAQVGEIRLRPARTVFTMEMDLSVSTDVPPGANPEYQWYRNGRKISGAIGTTLLAGALKKGDEVFVEVTLRGPHGARSKPKRSRKVKVANMPPKITSRPPTGEINGYQVRAEDIDGDTVTFTLEEAPPGATISSSGRLSWNGPFEPGKTYSLKIKASDGDAGGTVTQVIPIRIPGTPKPAPSGTPK